MPRNGPSHRTGTPSWPPCTEALGLGPRLALAVLLLLMLLLLLLLPPLVVLVVVVLVVVVAAVVVELRCSVCGAVVRSRAPWIQQCTEASAEAWIWWRRSSGDSRSCGFGSHFTSHFIVLL